MTAFEQFIAQEYGRKEGDDIDDIYDEARARWRQMRTQPAEAFTPNAQAVLDPDAQTRQAQNMFASLSNNSDLPVGGDVDLTRNQRGDLLSPIRESYSGNFKNALLTPANQSIFDDLPDSGRLRQEQAREMEIAQRQASGAEGAAQPQGLPSELVHQVWRMFADDYRDYSVRVKGGAIKSEPRKQLIDDFTRGFAENYAPVLGVTQAEAEAIAEKAASETRPIQPSDWMGGTADSLNLKEINDRITAARGLREMGREEQAQALLDQVPSLAQQEDVFSDSMTLIAENDQLQRSLQTGERWTNPQDGNVLERKQIEARIRDNQNKLSGYSSALATYPTQEGRVLNVDQELQKYVQDDGTILPSQVNRFNTEIARLAKENPNLMVISGGGLAPAAQFKYEIPTETETGTRPPTEPQAPQPIIAPTPAQTSSRATLDEVNAILNDPNSTPTQRAFAASKKKEIESSIARANTQVEEQRQEQERQLTESWRGWRDQIDKQITDTDWLGTITGPEEGVDPNDYFEALRDIDSKAPFELRDYLLRLGLLVGRRGTGGLTLKRNIDPKLKEAVAQEIQRKLAEIDFEDWQGLSTSPYKDLHKYIPAGLFKENK